MGRMEVHIDNININLIIQRLINDRKRQIHIQNINKCTKVEKNLIRRKRKERFVLAFPLKY